MQKNYLRQFIFLVVLFCFFSAQAQRNPVKSLEIFSQKNSANKNLKTQGTQNDCDTINNPLPAGWVQTYYYYGSSYQSGGYVNGVNQYGDKEKAQYFDLSTTAYSYITGARFYFYKATSNVPANLATNVNFKVYEDNGGVPGQKLGSSFSVPLSQINADVNAGKTTDIVFPAAIALPVSKKFYVSMDVSGFKWSPDAGKVTKDSISLFSSTNGDPDGTGAWEMRSDNSWYSYQDSEFINVALLILPYVSVGTTGCSVLPVKLLSFDANRKNSDVTLTWKISSELNMKQYEIQRADNNSNFKTVATLTAFNSSKDQSYTVTDKNAFNLSSAVQYRLKQVDGDGAVTYSRTITVKSNTAITDISFANPFTGSLKLQLNLATAQLVAVNVYDIQGQLVASEIPKTYNASANTIILNATGSLKSGLYILKVNAGKEQGVYKVLKN